MVVAVDENEALRLRLRDPDKKTVVLFLIDDRIAFRGGAEDVAQHLERAMIVIEERVEEAPAIGRPDRGAGCAVHFVRKIAAAREVANMDAVELRTLVVERPRGEPMIGRAR